MSQQAASPTVRKETQKMNQDARKANKFNQKKGVVLMGTFHKTISVIFIYTEYFYYENIR